MLSYLLLLLLLAKVCHSELPFDYLGSKAATQDILSLIYHRYELSGSVGPEFWYTTNNIGAFTWDVIKYKIAAKAMRGNQTFLMIFGGSSVTAGHDSYFNQSFPMIVKQRMTPAFKKLGINLVVRNIALGANPCIPYTYCYESMGGLDPDFLAWEQAYNCGHAPEVYETLARIAHQTRQHTVTYYSASGAWVPSDCPASAERVPYCAEEWTPADANLSPWTADTEKVQHIKLTLDRYHRAKPSAQR